MMPKTAPGSGFRSASSITASVSSLQDPSKREVIYSDEGGIKNGFVLNENDFIRAEMRGPVLWVVQNSGSIYAYDTSNLSSVSREIRSGSPVEFSSGTQDWINFDGFELFGDNLVVTARDDTTSNDGIAIVGGVTGTLSASGSVFNSSWPDFKDVDVSGDFAFAVGSDEIFSFDVSDPTSPTQSSSNGVVFDGATDVEVVNDDAFARWTVTGAEAFGQVWDVSDPTNITSYTGVAQLSDGSVGDFAVSPNGNLSYAVTQSVSSGNQLFGVADTSDPTSQTVIAEIETSTSNAFRTLNLFGDFVVGSTDSSVHVFNVSKPNYPAEISSTEVSALNPNEAVQRGGILFTVGGKVVALA